MSSANFWHFYHISRKKKYGPFSFEQLCSIFTKNNIQENEILIFKNGWSKWQSPNVEPLFKDFFTQNETVSPLESSNVENDVSEANIIANLNTIIISGKKSFKTKTLYISDNSIILQHNLPHVFKDKPIQLYIKSPDNRTSLKMSAQIISAEKEMLKIKIENEFSQKTYERWLNYFKEKQNMHSPLKMSA